MKILTSVIALSFMMILLGSAVFLYRDTLCRQKAWSKAFELSTRSLLSDPGQMKLSAIPSCRIILRDEQENISWQKFPGFKKNIFHLPVIGKL